MPQSDSNYVRIFDTTLRDGEQSPGATMVASEKLEIARTLGRMGVDIIEAGFPAASPDDFDAVYRIASEVGNSCFSGKQEAPVICGLARATESDIHKAWEAVRQAARPRIHTFLATSRIHMEHKLRMDPEQVIDQVISMVSVARGYCDDVEFSPEDAGRSDPAFLYVVLEEAIKAGATTLNIPDTVGYTMPEEFGRLIAGIMENTPGIEDVTVSVHCHNDLGLATANTLAGIQNGARQVEVTINGIGERAGNTSMEEVVMALHTRQARFGYKTGIDTTQIMRASRLVSNYTGITVQPNKAIVGENAFAHEAGIHQDGMLKHEETYEIMRPETVGASHTKLVLGKHSGRAALKARLVDMGYDLDDEELGKLFARFKLLADKKKSITDADLEALMVDEIYQPREVYRLEGLQVACGTTGLASATVQLLGPNGDLYVEAATGTGPIHATYSAIDQVIGHRVTLMEYAVNAITKGIDALGEVSVRVQYTNGEDKQSVNPQSGASSNRTFGGHGADTDIIVASARAYLSALNKVVVAYNLVKPAEAEEEGSDDMELPLMNDVFGDNGSNLYNPN